MDNEALRQDIQQAVQTMRKGGIILYPTDTVWGIGCDATNPQAVQKIYQLKRRQESKSMIVLVDSVDRAAPYATGLTDLAATLIEAADKPLTLILDGAKNVARNLIAPDGSIGLRVTSETYSKQLCYRLQKPVVSTSANISGQPPAKTFAEIPQEIIDGVDYVALYRRDDNTTHRPSSIVKLQQDGQVKIIRE